MKKIIKLMGIKIEIRIIVLITKIIVLEKKVIKPKIELKFKI
jgi:hypothetical protein